MSRVVADGFHQLSQCGLVVGQSWTGIIVERRGDRGRASKIIGVCFATHHQCCWGKGPLDRSRISPDSDWSSEQLWSQRVINARLCEPGKKVSRDLASYLDGLQTGAAE